MPKGAMSDLEKARVRFANALKTLEEAASAPRAPSRGPDAETLDRLERHLNAAEEAIRAAMRDDAANGDEAENDGPA